MKIFLLFVTFFALLGARENPFVPTSELNTSVMTTNVKESYENFEREDVSLPPDASLLLGVSLRYRASDGSIKHKNFDINKSIPIGTQLILKDPSLPEKTAQKLDVSVTAIENKPIVMPERNETKRGAHTLAPIAVPTPEPINLTSQAPKKQEPTNPLPKQAGEKPAIPSQTGGYVAVVKSEQNNSSVAEQNLSNTQTSLEKSEFKWQTKPAKHSSAKSFKFLDFVEFEINDFELKILTKDALVRHFAYENNKIVIDLKRDRRTFQTSRTNLANKGFADMTIGWHKGSYRIVVRTDARYKYELKKQDYGYLLVLKR